MNHRGLSAEPSFEEENIVKYHIRSMGMQQKESPKHWYPFLRKEMNFL